MRERKTCVRKNDRPGVSESRDAHLMAPITRKHALIGATSIQALPLSFVKPIEADSRT
jgi:hypothetical protein